MKRFFLIPILTVAALLSAQLNATAVTYSVPNTDYNTVTAADNVSAERVAALVNNYRRQNGLRELKVYPLLAKAASVRAEELSRSFSHTRPNGSAFYSIVDSYGIPWGRVAENAALGQPTPESAVNSWVNSENHRKNLLNPDFNYIGVGAYYYNGTYYWDQIFIQASQNFSDSYVPRNIGDADQNGFLDGQDASLVLTEYARTSVGRNSVLSETQKAYADMNTDGIIDAIDASAILRAYAKASVG